MGWGGNWNHEPITEAHLAQAHGALDAAREIGVTLIDHADIYTLGKAERTFGALLRRAPSLRDGLLLQTKCGIRLQGADGPGRYDLSRDYIVAATHASLERLGTDQIDILLLHRADPLMEPAEIAEAFSRLRQSGKVRHLGVSNMHAGHMRWLQQALDAPLVVNQLQMSLLQLDWLDSGTCFNDAAGAGTQTWGDTLQHCQSQGVQIQAWGPLVKGWLSGALPDDASPVLRATAALVQQLAEHHAVPRESLVLAWLMQHPAGIQPVIGSTHPDRIRACGAAAQVRLSRAEWYQLYITARGNNLP